MRIEPRTEGTGYFGKVPTHGDFVSARLDLRTLEALDAWLQACIRQSQAMLGREWLNAFLVAPVWRMAFGPGVCGAQPVLAVMMPSVDRVGRYFPLVLAVPVPKAAIGIDDLIEASNWYDASERLILSTLEEGFSLGAFDATAAQLSISPRVVETPVPDPLAALCWTNGSETAAPRAFVADALPPTEAFAPMITGSLMPLEFGALGVTEIPRAPRTPSADHTPAPDLAPGVDHAPVTGRAAISIEAAAASLKGARERQHAEATTVTPDHQLFAVVSGIGDRPESAIAARIVSDALTTVEAPFSMSDLVAEAKGKLGKAHTLIRTRSAGAADPAAATVAALLVQGRRYTVVWAGAVRCFLLRAGTLHMLTRDHVETRLPMLLTRVIGGADPLSPDTAIGHVEPGDRFLLCSRGLHAALADAELAETLLRAKTPAAAAQALTQDALIAGADHSATALAVFVHPATPGRGDPASPGSTEPYHAPLA
ncbi:MAG: type VI secretion system-associated protein TagF [Pseudomonadota bacterium]